MAWWGRKGGHSGDEDENAQRDIDQALSDLSQTHSDVDQSAADVDATASASDSAGSLADQTDADADQRASDADQAFSDRQLGEEADPEGQREVHDESQHQRERSTHRRHGTQVSRTHSELERIRVDAQRIETAGIRDDVAAERDRAAEIRDGAAARAEAALLASAPGNVALRAAVSTNTELRDLASADRRRAASDRQRAAEDRLTAAAAQRQARIDVQRAQLDGQTGVYARELGYVTLRSEIDRCRRADDPFVLALIRIDQQVAIDARQTPADRDAVIEAVVFVLRDQLRSYDPVVRVGASEFLCALPGSRAEDARERVDEIRQAAADGHPEAHVTVGLATLRPEDTLGSLVERAAANLPAT